MKKIVGFICYGLLAWSFICGWVERSATTSPGLEALIAMALHSSPVSTDIHIQSPHLSLDVTNRDIACKLDIGNNTLCFGGQGSWGADALDLRIESSGEIAPLLKGLHPRSLFISGEYTMSAHITGSWANPRLHYAVSIDKGVIDSLSTGAHLEGITALIESDGKEGVLKEISGHDGQGGTFRGEGSFSLMDDFAYALSMEIHKVSLAKLDHIAGLFSGQLTFAGNEKGASIEGTLIGDSVALALNESKSAPKSVDITYINGSPRLPPKQERPNEWPLALNIEIKSPQNIWITTEDLSSEWRADIKLEGTSRAPLVYGTLEMIHGHYMTSGKTIIIQEGTISFDGDPIKNATLSVVGNLDTKTITAEVLVTGPLTNPSLSLRSNPPLPQAEILSHLVFGRGLADITTQQSKHLKKSIADLKAMSAGSNILDGMRSRFGIDRIEISRGTGNELEDVSVQVGKYLTNSLYIAFNKGITSPTNRIIVEAALRPNLKLQGELSDTAEGELHLKWRHDY